MSIIDPSTLGIAGPGFMTSQLLSEVSQVKAAQVVPGSTDVGSGTSSYSYQSTMDDSQLAQEYSQAAAKQFDSGTDVMKNFIGAGIGDLTNSADRVAAMFSSVIDSIKDQGNALTHVKFTS